MLRNPNKSIKLLSVCAGFLITWGMEKKKLTFNGISFICKVSMGQSPVASLLCVQVLAAVKPHKDGRRCRALIYHPPFAWKRVESLKQPMAVPHTILHGSGAVTRDSSSSRAVYLAQRQEGSAPEMPSPREPRLAVRHRFGNALEPAGVRLCLLPRFGKD